MVTETKQATQKLGDALKGQPSDENDEVTEEAVKDGNTLKKAGEAEAEKVKVEEVKSVAFTPEQETEIASRIRSETDKQINSHREKRESDTALHRSNAARIAELEQQIRTKGNERTLKAILDADEEEGLGEDKIEARQAHIKDLLAREDKYLKNASVVEEVALAAQAVNNNLTGIAASASKKFGLDDPNPVIRAKNYAEFVNEAIYAFNYNHDFLMAMESFLPKGDELRQQIEGIVEEMADPELNLTTDKSKKIFLNDRLQGVKVVPRKKPPAPSDGSGGLDLSGLKPVEKIARALEKSERR